MQCQLLFDNAFDYRQEDMVCLKSTQNINSAQTDTTVMEIKRKSASILPKLYKYLNVLTVYKKSKPLCS